VQINLTPLLSDLQPSNLALFYAHPKTDSGQFEEEEEEGADWPRAILCFRLFSSCVSKDISNLFYLELSQIFVRL